MLNYAQTTKTSTIVHLITPPHEGTLNATPKRITEPLPVISPDMEQHQGQDAGRIEAKQVLDQAQRRKGDALNQREIREVYVARFNVRMNEVSIAQARWFDGWCQGFVEVMIRPSALHPLHQWQSLRHQRSHEPL